MRKFLQIRRRAAARNVAAWAMVLLQLNLFFILLLHHSEFGESLRDLCLPLQAIPTLATENPGTPPHACAACQIARLGSIIPFSAPAIRARFAVAPLSTDPVIPLHASNTYLRLPGRDPPRG